MKFPNTHMHTRQIDSLGGRLAKSLDGGLLDLHPDILERLRIARESAVSRRHIVILQSSHAVQSRSPSGELTLGGGSWWARLSAFAPLAVLVVGLVLISVMADEQRAHELADVDTELLSDELPPSAYSDPGFAKFLQLKGRD